MKTTTNMKLDLCKPNYSACIEAIQNDSETRMVTAVLLEDGKPWRIPEGITAAVAYRKPDHTKGLYNKLADGTQAVRLSGYTATFVLAQQMLTVPGNVQGAIVFNDKNLNQLSSFPFTVTVAENLFCGAALSEDYIRLQWLEDKLDEYLTAAKNSGEFDGKDGLSPVLLSDSVSYQAGVSGQTPPDGEWLPHIPQVPRGYYLWTRRIKHWSGSDPITDYSVSYMGLDGAGSVASVNQVSPDASGNVVLTADDVGALSAAGGDITGQIRMNGHTISGLNTPTEATQAASKGYVDAAATAANAYTDASVRKAAPRNLLDNSDFRNPVNQRGSGIYSGAKYTIDRWKGISSALSVSLGTDSITISGHWLYQILESNRIKSGVTYTLAGCKSDGSLSVVNFTQGNTAVINNEICYEFVDNNDRVGLYTGTWKWAAVYEGEYTADTIPEYQARGYGAELAECQRYYFQSWDSSNISSDDILIRCAVTTARLVSVEFPVTMIKTPTVILYTYNGVENAVKSWTSSEVVQNVSPVYAGKKGFTPASADGNFVSGTYYGFHYAASADLM